MFGQGGGDLTVTLLPLLATSGQTDRALNPQLQQPTAVLLYGLIDVLFGRDDEAREDSVHVDVFLTPFHYFFSNFLQQTNDEHPDISYDNWTIFKVVLYLRAVVILRVFSDYENIRKYIFE